MIWFDKKAFKDTYKILKQEKILEPIYVDLKQFIEETFDIKVYNIVLQPIRSSLFAKKIRDSYFKNLKYKLICYVGSVTDREKMQTKIDVHLDKFPNAHKMVNDREKQNVILNRFFDLSEKYKFTIKVKKHEIWVDYFYWFSTDYLGFIVNSKVKKQVIDNILSKYEKEANIWKIYTSGFGFYVFYQTDKDLIANRENGINENVKKVILLAIKELDEFDFYKEDYIVFDSKENLDKNYSGNVYYYLR